MACQQAPVQIVNNVAQFPLASRCPPVIHLERQVGIVSDHVLIDARGCYTVMGVKANFLSDGYSLNRDARMRILALLSCDLDPKGELCGDGSN